MKLYTIYGDNVGDYLTKHYGDGKSMSCDTCSLLKCYNSVLTHTGILPDMDRRRICCNWRSYYEIT